MDDLERERDFYRQHCNELGSRILRLQEDQARAWRETRRSRTIAGLIREIYRVADSRISLDEIGQRFLQVILDRLCVDRAALLSYLPEQGCFLPQHTLGFAPQTQPNFSPPRLPDDFYFVNSKSDCGPLPDGLLQAAGVPYLLWVFDVEARLALMVGSAIEDQHLHRPFEAGDREILESALSVFVELVDRKRAENLAAISRLALKLADVTPGVDLLELLAEELKSITAALATSVSLYDPKTEVLMVKQIACSNRVLSTVNKLIGRNLVGMRIPVSRAYLKQMSTEVVGELSDLSETTFGTIPKPVAAGVQKALGIGEVRGLALHDGNDLLGTAAIIMPKGRLPLPVDVLKIFAHVAAVALQRRQAEERIQDSLREKEVLLQEIHHRVKNNLQVISSLLRLQSDRIQDIQAREIFKDSQSRVRSMALIHEKLYRSEDLAQIDFGSYIRDLADFLFSFYEARERGLSLTIQADTVLLGIDTAVPCGLILNELVSNILKHAFPSGRSGDTLIEFSNNLDGQMMLMVKDNGIGFPEDVDYRDTESLGLQLVTTLVQQLEGSMELERDRGTEFTITFPPA